MRIREQRKQALVSEYMSYMEKLSYSVNNAVYDLAEDYFGVTNPGPSTRLPNDWLGKVEFGMALEEEFDMNIPDATARGFKTVGDAISYVKANIGKPKKSNKPTKIWPF